MLSCYSQVSLQGCHQSLMPTYRLPQSACNVTPLDEVGMTSDTQRVEVPTTALSWYADEENDQLDAGPSFARVVNAIVLRH